MMNEQERLAQQQLMYAAQFEEDEIDLLEYWNLIWQEKKFIATVTFTVALLVAGLSLTMPNIYRSEVLLAPMGGEEDKGGLSSMLGGLGGLASMAGVSLGGGSVEESLAVLKSRSFIWGFVQDEKLLPVLFVDSWDKDKKKWRDDDVENQPTLWDAWRLLVEDGVLGSSVDSDSGLVRLSIDWDDPVLAQLWAEKLVQRLNKHLREQAIQQSQMKLEYLHKELATTHIEENRNALFGLISAEQKQAMLANTQQDFAFRVIDAASIPDKKIKPKRAIIVIVAAFVAGFLCVVWVFIQAGMRKRKEEEGVV